MAIVRLGVNIDHVATLRQARGEVYPSVEEAARVCLRAGADQITIHLREDRRHIQDADVQVIREVTREFNKPLNLEMGCEESVLKIALLQQPDWVCLVPEKRQEKTTEGGINLIDHQQFKKIEATCLRLKEKIQNVKISLFLQAQSEILEKSIQLPIDAVEIHTGEWARSFLYATPQAQDELNAYLHQFYKAKEFLHKHHLACHAGHGLTNKSVLPLLKNKIFEEYNIGHYIVGQALFDGLDHVIRHFKGLFNENS